MIANRKNLLPEIKNSKLKHLKTKYYRSNTGILLYMWRDKKASKPVIAVSTYTKKKEVEVTNKRGQVTTKPKMINEPATP